MIRRKRLKELETRLAAVERLLDKVDRSVERIELVTVVREPSTSMSADAYNGLRKQVIAAAGERNAHLHQLAQFDLALRQGASLDDLAAMARGWLAESSVEAVEDPSLTDAFDVVGPADAGELRVVRPAYVDAITRRVVQPGVAERVPEGAQRQPGDGESVVSEAGGVR